MHRFKDHLQYWDYVAPRLGVFVQQQYDAAFDHALLEALAFYSFTSENLSDRATQRKEDVPKAAPLIIITQDILRGLLAAHRDLSLVSLAALARVALEARITSHFIITSDDPPKYLDRYFRFADVRALIDDFHKMKAGELSLLSPHRREQLEGNATEWVRKKLAGKNGGYLDAWTAEEGLGSVAKIAEVAGLGPEYRSTYAVTSKYVHCSSMVRGLYSGPNGMNAIGQKEHCRTLATLGMGHAMAVLSDLCEYFGVPFDRVAHGGWVVRLGIAIGAVPKDTPQAPKPAGVASQLPRRET